MVGSVSKFSKYSGAPIRGIWHVMTNDHYLFICLHFCLHFCAFMARSNTEQKLVT